MPKGWNLITAGQYGTFSFLLTDPAQPLRKVFYFGEAGPVYLCKEQKEIDKWYMQNGGYPISWIDMPVVDPLTPENFLEQFNVIAKSQVAQAFMPQCPKLQSIKIISSEPAQGPIQFGSTSLIRALFVENKKVGEGQFMVTVAPYMQYMGAPGSGIGYGLLFVGITAPKSEFALLQGTLKKVLESFTVSQEYVNAGIAASNSAFQGILRAGRTLGEASDMIMEGWQNRNRSYDIMSEKQSDAILGYERVYNPDTGEVYSVPNGFYEKYEQNRNSYQMNNLQQLPDNDYSLWTAPTLDGSRIR